MPLQGSTLRKNFTSPAGLVTVTFTSPEIFFASPEINNKKIQIVTNPIASVDNMKRMQCIVLNKSFIIIQVCRAKGGLHTFSSADILSSPLGLLTVRIY